MLVINTGIFKGALMHCGTARHKHDWSHVVRVRADDDFITIDSTDAVTSFHAKVVNASYIHANVTIHMDTIKLAIQQKTKVICIEKIDMVGGESCFMMNGTIKFKSSYELPNTDRLIPSHRGFGYPDQNDQLHFDFSLLNKCQDSLRLASGRRDALACLQYPRDNSQIGMIRLHDDDSFFCLLAGLKLPD